MSEEAKNILKSVLGIHGKIVADVPQLQRGRVWCIECGATQRVDSAQCLRSGWPKCCGYTMTIDSPEDRAKVKP